MKASELLLDRTSELKEFISMVEKFIKMKGAGEEMLTIYKKNKLDLKILDEAIKLLNDNNL